MENLTDHPVVFLVGFLIGAAIEILFIIYERDRKY